MSTREHRIDDVTVEIDVTSTKRGGRHVLLVIREDGTSETHPLPHEGIVTIGRSLDCEVRIDDPSISRRHARLHIGPPLRVEDLGSANGTRVRDARLDPSASLPSGNTTERLRDKKVTSEKMVDLAPGDVIHFGSTMAFVQLAPPSSRLRRLWPHGYFEGVLEKECARSERSGSSFAVLRVAMSGNVDREDAEEALAASTRSVDIVAIYGPDEYEILLVDAEPAKIDEVTSRITTQLGKGGARVRVGVARYPQDGRDPESLEAKASARVRGGEVPEGITKAVVVEDPAMQRLYRMAQRVADSNISVLLLGETGVGKEVLAEAIHSMSPRGKKPFLKLNCAAFSEQLLESELFGYEKGAFTGAVASKQGLLETAHTGTVFLDEVGELPMSTQVKLLRVLEERMVLHVGGLKSRSIDVRFVAATNRDLEAEIERGTFREDLFFRLNGISLVIPPLRDRPTEIEPFARMFAVDLAKKSHRRSPEFSPEAMEILRHYSWPGNIREMRNVMERAVLLSADGVITSEHLPVDKMGSALPGRALRSMPPAAPPRPPSPPAVAPGASIASTYVPPPPPSDSGPDTARISRVDVEELKRLSPEALRGKVEEVEKSRVLAALAQCAGNQTAAAKLLGISRRTLVTRLETFNVPRPRKAPPTST